MKAEEIIADVDVTIKLFESMEVRDRGYGINDQLLQYAFKQMAERLTKVKEWAETNKASIDLIELENRLDAK